MGLSNCHLSATTMLEPTVFLTADRAVSVRVHKMKLNDTWVFSVFDFIIGVGDTKKKYSESVGHVWLHALQNNMDEDSIQNCPLVLFPGPLESPKGIPCVSAFGLAVLFSYMHQEFPHRVKEEYRKEIEDTITSMLGNNVEGRVEMYDDGEIEAGGNYAGVKRKYSYLVDGVEMTESEIGTMRSDFTERIKKMEEQYEAERKRLTTELKMANVQLVKVNETVEFEKKKKTAVRLGQILEDMKIEVKNATHLRELGLKVKTAFETEYDGKTFKNNDTVFYFAEDRQVVEHLVQREWTLIKVEVPSAPETSSAFVVPEGSG